MKAVLINQYGTTSKTTGNRVEMSVYEIIEATKEELEAYVDFQNAEGNYRENEATGNALFFNAGDLGNNITIVFGKKKDANGDLIDGYRGLAGEDWRLKKSIVREEMSAPATRVIASRPKAKVTGDPKF